MHGNAGLVLAAGGSTRMGEPKQLIEIDGETLVHRAVRTALEGGCDRVCVVTGHAREAVEKAVADLSPTLVHHPEWTRGMGSSLRIGVNSVRTASGVVVMACDQPAVDSSIVRSLISEQLRSGRPIVASRYSGTCGIPALFRQSCFAELEALPDDCGAKATILSDPDRVAFVDFPAGAFDLDFPGDVNAWRERAKPRVVSSVA